MKVLVTGASGFIGTSVLEELLSADVEVRSYDISSSEGVSMEGVEYIRGDIFDLGSLQDAVQGVDFVIHLVGVRDARIAEVDPGKSFRLNVLSLQNVLEACRLNRTKRLLFPSSAAVYGRTNKLPVSEEDPIRPTSIYAYQKSLCEDLIRAYRAVFGARYTILRIFNAFGRGNQNVIGHCIRAAKEGTPVEIFGADQLRDFIRIGDVARSFRAAVLSDGLEDRTINVGSGRGWKIQDAVGFVKKMFPHLEARFIDNGNFIPYHSVADVTLMRDLLGFAAEGGDDLFEDVIREIGEDVEECDPSVVGR